MNIQIDSAVKRARGYWFVDGFTEMAAGGLFALLAKLLLFTAVTSHASFPTWFLTVAGEISIAKVIGIVAAVLILWWLKNHFTYPRTGFVRGKRISAAQVWNLIWNAFLFLLLPIFGVLTASLLITSTGKVLASMTVWFPMGLGLIWAILCVVAGEWIGLRRFRVLGGLILLAGLAIGFWQLSMGVPVLPASVQGISQTLVLEVIDRTVVSIGVLTLISGALLIFSGLTTFLHYRKENPTPYTEGV